MDSARGGGSASSASAACSRPGQELLVAGARPQPFDGRRDLVEEAECENHLPGDVLVVSASDFGQLDARIPELAEKLRGLRGDLLLDEGVLGGLVAALEVDVSGQPRDQLERTDQPGEPVVVRLEGVLLPEFLVDEDPLAVAPDLGAHRRVVGADQPAVGLLHGPGGNAAEGQPGTIGELELPAPHGAGVQVTAVELVVRAALGRLGRLGVGPLEHLELVSDRARFARHDRCRQGQRHPECQKGFHGRFLICPLRSRWAWPASSAA
jgi:hypothetical protein